MLAGRVGVPQRKVVVAAPSARTTTPAARPLYTGTLSVVSLRQAGSWEQATSRRYVVVCVGATSSVGSVLNSCSTRPLATSLQRNRIEPFWHTGISEAAPLSRTRLPGANDSAGSAAARATTCGASHTPVRPAGHNAP